MPNFNRHLEFSVACSFFILIFIFILYYYGIIQNLFSAIFFGIFFFIFGSILPDIDSSNKKNSSISFRIFNVFLLGFSFSFLIQKFHFLFSLINSIFCVLIFSFLMNLTKHRFGVIHSVEAGIIYAFLIYILCSKLLIIDLFFISLFAFMGFLSHLFLDKKEGGVKFSMFLIIKVLNYLFK